MEATRVNVNDPVYQDIVDIFQTSGMSTEETAIALIQHMAMEARRNGMSDEKVASNLMLFQSQIEQYYLSSELAIRQREKQEYERLKTEEDLQKRKMRVLFWKNFHQYFNIILHSELQRLAYSVKDDLKDAGLYKQEVKKKVNVLIEKAKELQISCKDNDKRATVGWCKMAGINEKLAERFYKDGATIGWRFVKAFNKKFKTKLDILKLDCMQIAKSRGCSPSYVGKNLYLLIALADTCIELEDICTKYIKREKCEYLRIDYIPHGRVVEIKKAAATVVEKIAKKNGTIPDEEVLRARKNLADFQKTLAEEGSGDFFQVEFNEQKKEFINYTLAIMRMEMENGGLTRESMETLLARMQRKEDVRKIIKQLKSVRLPEDPEFNIMDVARSVANHNFKTPMMDKYREMCYEGKFYEPTKEELDKEGDRILRTVARKHGGLLPDDVLRVVTYHHKTKKSLLEHLKRIGPEVAPTLRKVKKLKVSELKQI